MRYSIVNPPRGNAVVSQSTAWDAYGPSSRHRVTTAMQQMDKQDLCRARRQRFWHETPLSMAMCGPNTPIGHPRAVMPWTADNAILKFPSRLISPGERALLAEWFATTQRKGLDVHRAFVSEHRSDDPMLFGRIVIELRSSKEPAFLIHSLAEMLGGAGRGGTLCHLRTALNSIRPVLDEPCSMGGEATLWRRMRYEWRRGAVPHCC